jgi:hypothetical protein
LFAGDRVTTPEEKEQILKERLATRGSVKLLAGRIEKDLSLMGLQDLERQVKEIEAR